jgi:hypothetical protein
MMGVVKETAPGRQSDVCHRVLESDDDENSERDAHTAATTTTTTPAVVVVAEAPPPAPPAKSVKPTIPSPVLMDVLMARSEEGIYFIFQNTNQKFPKRHRLWY